MTILKFEDKERELLDNCPWCGSKEFEKWGEPLRGFFSVKCKSCSIIFVKNRLNQKGLNKFFKNYLSEQHQFEDEKKTQRNTMYLLEFKALQQFIKPSRVLDVGCSGGYFLDIFKANGFDCYGIELGEEAAKIASMKHPIWMGELPHFDTNKMFDLIIFRGVLHMAPNPKQYIDKAISLLNTGGLLFISSSPNGASICSNLFKENWSLHFPEESLLHLTSAHLDPYMNEKGLSKILEYSYYMETPYAKPEEDILMIAKAIELKRSGKNIDFKSPAFWGNMLTLIYKN